jgi:hypothetical protein
LEAVVVVAQQHQVVDVVGAARGPPVGVVHVATTGGQVTAGEGAAAVAQDDRFASAGADLALPVGAAQGDVAVVEDHAVDAGVAAHALGGVGSEGVVGVGQHPAGGGSPVVEVDDRGDP